MEICIDAPAKINLHLQVGRKREDGYHDLLSVFHLVDLADTLRVEKSGPAGEIAVHGPFDFPVKDNLIHKAAERYFSGYRLNTGKEPEAGVEVRCTKRIPDGGGLGGGSSDAAAALKALSLLFPVSEPERLLRESALAVGSDVPFFLSTPAALAEGRGELLRPLPPLKGYALLLLFPGLKISTPAAYRAVDRRREKGAAEKTRFCAEELESGWEKLMRSGSLYNDFTPAVEEFFPGVEGFLRELREAGAVFAEMSGSGSTIFAIFHKNSDAERASRLFLERGWGAHTGKMLARPIEPVYNEPII